MPDRLLRVMLQAVCASAFCVLLAAPVSGAEVDPPSRLIAETKARELLNAGAAREALAILRVLADRHPERQNVRFLLGLAAIESARQPQVQEAERRGVVWTRRLRRCAVCWSNNPGLVRVRLELARAFFLQGERTACRRNTSSVSWRATRPCRWWPMSGASFRIIRASAGAGTCTWASRWRRIPISAAPPTKEPSTSSGCRSCRDAESLTTSGVGLNGVGRWGVPTSPWGQRVRLRMGMDASAARSTRAGKFDRMLVSWHVGPRVFVSRERRSSASWATGATSGAPTTPISFDLGGRV